MLCYVMFCVYLTLYFIDASFFCSVYKLFLLFHSLIRIFSSKVFSIIFYFFFKLFSLQISHLCSSTSCIILYVSFVSFLSLTSSLCFITQNFPRPDYRFLHLFLIFPNIFSFFNFTSYILLYLLFSMSDFISWFQVTSFSFSFHFVEFSRLRLISISSLFFHHFFLYLLLFLFIQLYIFLSMLVFFLDFRLQILFFVTQNFPDSDNSL